MRPFGWYSNFVTPHDQQINSLVLREATTNISWDSLFYSSVALSTTAFVLVFQGPLGLESNTVYRDHSFSNPNPISFHYQTQYKSCWENPLNRPRKNPIFPWRWWTSRPALCGIVAKPCRRCQLRRPPQRHDQASRAPNCAKSSTARLTWAVKIGKNEWTNERTHARNITTIRPTSENMCLAPMAKV